MEQPESREERSYWFSICVIKVSLMGSYRPRSMTMWTKLGELWPNCEICKSPLMNYARLNFNIRFDIKHNNLVNKTNK